MQNKVLHYTLVGLAIALFVLGRLCDNLNWYDWDGIESVHLQAIAFAGVASAAIVITIIRLLQKDGAKILFIHSQLKFFIPWALIILQSVLLFKIWGCTDNEALLNENPEYYTYKGCIFSCLVLLLSNYVYSTVCSQLGQTAFLLTFQIIVFAEVIYNGNLIVRFIQVLEGAPKDYSILYISIIIAYQIIVMDLMFRAAYEDREKEQKIHHIHKKVEQHHQNCKLVRYDTKQQTDVRINEESAEVKHLNQVEFKLNVKKPNQ